MPCAAKQVNKLTEEYCPGDDKYKVIVGSTECIPCVLVVYSPTVCVHQVSGCPQSLSGVGVSGVLKDMWSRRFWVYCGEGIPSNGDDVCPYR